MPKISVIICAYNAAKTIKKAAESVLSQSFRDIELIIVNDGSKDSTLAKINEIAMRDSRVKIINISNGGLANARNIGLKHAKGEYIAFCDADDYIDDGAFNSMYSSALETKSDMVVAGYFHDVVLKNGEIKRTEMSAKDAVYTSKQELFADFIELKSKYILDASWNKLFKKSVIVDKGLSFIKGELFEDTAFVFDFLEVTQNISVINQCFYHYVQHKSQGITRQYDANKLQYLTKRYLQILKFVDFNDELQKFCHLYQLRNVYSCLSASFGVKDMAKIERTNLIKTAISDSVFLECAAKAGGNGLANKVTIFVAKSKSLCLNRLYCKMVYCLKTNFATLFTKIKR